MTFCLYIYTLAVSLKNWFLSILDIDKKIFIVLSHLREFYNLNILYLFWRLRIQKFIWKEQHILVFFILNRITAYFEQMLNVIKQLQSTMILRKNVTWTWLKWHSWDCHEIISILTTVFNKLTSYLQVLKTYNVSVYHLTYTPDMVYIKLMIIKKWDS